MDLKKLFSLLVLCLSCVSAFSATIDDYAKLPEMQKVSISPDGSKLVFQRNTGDKRYAVVFDMASKKTIKVFDINQLNARSVYFLTDNFVILVVSEVMRMRGSAEHEYSMAYAYDIAGDKLRKTLTLGNGIYTNQTGLGSVIGVSPDHKFAYMPAYTEAGTINAPDVQFSVMRVNLKKGGRPKKLYAGSGDTLEYFVDDDGKVLAQVIMDNRRDEFIVKARGEKKRLIKVYEEESEQPTFSTHGLSADYKYLYVSYISDDSDTDTLARLSLATGEFSDPDLVTDDKDISHVFVSRNQIVQGIRYSGLSPSYQFFDTDLDQRVEAILAMFPGHSVWVSSVSDDLNAVVVLVEGSQFAGDYYLFQNGQAPTFIGSQRPDVDVANIHPQAKWGFKASDGLRIPVLMTIPKDRVADIKTLPTIVLPHGGPASHDTIGFDWLSQSLADQGYLVLQPQFRGSTGFGNKHYLAGQGEWGKKMQSDITETVNQLIDKGYVDPERICIMGWSYGGYAALAGGAFTPNLYQCVVSINGVSDLHGMLVQERRDHRKDSSVVAYWEEQMLGDAKPTKALLREISPVDHADAFQAPVMLIHGKDDVIVRQSQSDKMAKALRKLDKPVIYHKFKGESHGLTQVGTRIEMMEYVLPFLAEHLAVE